MLRIRLSRVGKRNHPQYKVVVAEKTSPVKGKFVEQLGSYDPHTKRLLVKEERVTYWLEHGADCSRTVHNLLIKNDIIKGEKIKLSFPEKKTAAETEAETEAEEGKVTGESKTGESKDEGKKEGGQEGKKDNKEEDQTDGKSEDDKPEDGKAKEEVKKEKKESEATEEAETQAKKKEEKA